MQTPGEMNVQLRLQLSHGQQQLRSPQQWVVEAFRTPTAQHPHHGCRQGLSATMHQLSTARQRWECGIRHGKLAFVLKQRVSQSWC
jgi:hypothetical protein